MPTTIKDGTGRGHSAEVTNSNKLMTLSVTEGIAAHHAFEGDAYNINTGSITLTSASKSALLYIKNLEDEDLIITGLFYLIGNSNTSGGDTLIQFERNPTGGTIVSAGTSFTPVNRNFGSSKTLNITCEKGAEGKTLTGGTVAVESIFASAGRKTVSVGAIILPRGSSMGITVTPQTSNTSQDYQIAVACYKVQESTLER
jgi:hypothetical protein